MQPGAESFDPTTGPSFSKATDLWLVGSMPTRQTPCAHKLLILLILYSPGELTFFTSPRAVHSAGRCQARRPGMLSYLCQKNARLIGITQAAYYFRWAEYCAHGCAANSAWRWATE